MNLAVPGGVSGFLLLRSPRIVAYAIGLWAVSRGKDGPTRVVGFLGLTAIFLFISPDLRAAIGNGYASALRSFLQYAPYSYVGLVLALVGVFLVCLSWGSSSTR